MRKDGNFIYVEITKEMLESAYQRNMHFQNIYGTSGTRLKGKNTKIRETGYLGEEIVRKAFPLLQLSPDPSFDFYIKKSDSQFVTFDVKSVGCNSMPQPHHVGTVFSHEGKVHTDCLIFTRILNDRSGGWITGFIKTSDFFQMCEQVKAGTQNNNFTYEHDRMTIEYGKLKMPRFG